jgi:hypothetical protein
MEERYNAFQNEPNPEYDRTDFRKLHSWILLIRKIIDLSEKPFMTPFSVKIVV